MVEKIINGGFDGSTGGRDADPVSWNVNETNALQVQVVQGALVFNRSGSAAGSSVSQQIPDVTIGQRVHFALDYKENGSGGNPSVLIEIVDGNGKVIFSQTATATGEHVAFDFVAESSSYTVRITDTSTGNLGGHDAVIDNVSFDVVCFARDTMIETPAGPVAVQDLKPGQLVSTIDHGNQPIRWIGRRKLSRATLTRKPALLPVRIPKGALGQNMPTAALLLSPQHRVLIRSKIAQRMFGSAEILAAARKLVGHHGIAVVEDAPEVEYFHLLCDRHEVLISNGAATELLYYGPMAARMLSPEDTAEIAALFGEPDAAVGSPLPARTLATGKKLQTLLMRHARNSKPFVAALPPQPGAVPGRGLARQGQPHGRSPALDHSAMSSRWISAARPS